ncbi:hypothetical protein H5410_023080 [Solanum commersonii]|uniref:Uncharacterized protein n=1 Tax=Solanum commersonii TaxID=4109 RepID=A0A9J5ZIF0_SOLCO|nr:hypothetical protein H5410_023080 [Solanum commersonii]
MEESTNTQKWPKQRHLRMANSKYEYGNVLRWKTAVMYPNIIVVQIDGRDFGRSLVQFLRSMDLRRMMTKALNLMNACAIKKETTFYQRRARLVTYFISQEFDINTYVELSKMDYKIQNVPHDLVKKTKKREMSYKQSIQYLFVEAGVFSKVEKEAKRDS